MPFSLGGALGGIVGAIVDPIGSIGSHVFKGASKTLAGTFNDVVTPFLGPIDKILNTFAPRFRIDANLDANIAAAVGGGTTHQFLFPQLPSLGGVAGAHDITGGLLSDLAFDSQSLRRTETDLDFLSSAIRRGVYPHRNDTFFLGVSAVPRVPLGSDLWIRVSVQDADDRRNDGELTMVLRAADATERLERLKKSVDDKFPVSAQYAALEQSQTVQLAARRGERRSLRIRVTGYNAAGAEIANPFGILRELSVWIERRNDGYTDVLHHFLCREPQEPLSLVFPLDRIEYRSEGNENWMNGISRDGGGYKNAADDVEAAKSLLEKPVEAPAGDVTGTDRLTGILAKRVERAEAVREHLWSARRKLTQLGAGDDAFDYRLRFKVRLENASTIKRTINSLRVRSDKIAESEFTLRQFDLPRHSRYDVTVYPLRHDEGAFTEAALEMADKQPHLMLGLVGGLGLSDSLLRSVLVTGDKTDLASVKWKVQDTTA